MIYNERLLVTYIISLLNLNVNKCFQKNVEHRNIIL